MKLRDYAEKLQEEGLLAGSRSAEAEAEIRFVTYHSKEVRPGTLFVCKGASFKEEYLQEAFEKGAAAYVAEKAYASYPGLLVRDIRRAQAVLANLFYGQAWRAFPLIGFTGTKGKTTAAFFLQSILDPYYERQGKAKTGRITTIDTYDGIECFESHLTTPEALDLGRHFANAKKAGLSAMIMEVSSQALKYGRSDGIEFQIGCFMNFSEDHIGAGEHSDVEDYFRSKLKLFSQCKTAVINADSARFSEIMRAAEASPVVEKIVTFSASGAKADVAAREIQRVGGKTRFTLAAGERPLGAIEIGMPGLFNVENALAACTVALELGVPAAELAGGLAQARVAGRMELFECPRRRLVVLADFAHNGLSFEKFFASVKQDFPGWRIEAVFGAPGNKAYQRRRDLPAVAARYADYVYLTEDDPGFEDPEAICEELAAPLREAGCPYAIIPDRALAVQTAIENAPPKTVVCLLAKGRETYLKRGAAYVPYEGDAAIAGRLVLALSQ